MSNAHFVVVLLSLAAAACVAANGASGGDRAASREASDLVLSLQVNPMGDSVGLTLQVTNGGSAPLPLEFRSGQEFDFAVLRGSQEIWRWSSDMMFTQALHTETLAPGETRTYRAAWRPPAGAQGEYTALGQLTVHDRRAEQRAIFRLP